MEEETSSYSMVLYKHVLYMLAARQVGRYPEITSHHLPSFLNYAKVSDFQLAITRGKNYLRDVISLSVESPPFRVLMSFLTLNKLDGKYTAVFFSDSGDKSQVSKILIKGFLSALALLSANDIEVSEVILINPVPLSHDAEALVFNALRGSYFLQLFRDEEILIMPTQSAWNSKIEIIPEREAAKFVDEEFRGLLDLSNLRTKIQCIPSTDTTLKYLGVKPGSVIRIERPPLVPGNLIRRERSLAWVF